MKTFKIEKNWDEIGNNLSIILKSFDENVICFMSNEKETYIRSTNFEAIKAINKKYKLNECELHKKDLFFGKNFNWTFRGNDNLFRYGYEG